MTQKTGIIRFDPNGPNGRGLTRMSLDPADFSSPLPEQNVHVYFEDQELGMSAGVWDTTTMQEAFGPYPGDEFILVLDGRFDMLDKDSNGIPAETGQCVIFRNGMPVSWKQDGYLKKFYITYMDPRAETPTDATIDGGFLTMDPGMTLSEEHKLDDPDSVQHEKIFFKNAHGNMEMGIWSTENMDSEMSAFPWHELCVAQDGEATIVEEDGTSHTFVKGDVFFVPAGTVCSWKIPTYFRKYFAALDPNIRPGD